MSEKFAQEVNNFYMEGFNKMVKREDARLKKNVIQESAGMADIEMLAQLIPGRAEDFISKIKTMDSGGQLKGIASEVDRNQGNIGIGTPAGFVAGLISDLVKRGRDASSLTAQGITQAWESFKKKFQGKDQASFAASEAFVLHRLFSKIYTEDDEPNAGNMSFGGTQGDAGQMGGGEGEEGEEEGENKDAMDKADEILSQIDLTDIDNDVRKELIEAIIDSAQNAAESDDDFSDFMTAIEEIIEDFRYEGEEEGGEELEPVEGEEINAAPDEGENLPETTEEGVKPVTGKKQYTEADDKLDKKIAAFKKIGFSAGQAKKLAEKGINPKKAQNIIDNGKNEALDDIAGLYKHLMGKMSKEELKSGQEAYKRSIQED